MWGAALLQGWYVTNYTIAAFWEIVVRDLGGLSINFLLHDQLLLNYY